MTNGKRMPIEPTTANEVLTRYRRWIDVGTWEWWHPHAGNAKARRRWRRRNLPNTQREAAREPFALGLAVTLNREQLQAIYPEKAGKP